MQGGADRRGVDDGNRRPASVKASLSVAMGQRAPNRSGAREEGRGKDPSVGNRVTTAAPSGRDKDKGGVTAGRSEASRKPSRSRSRSPPPARRDERGGGRDRDADRDRPYDR